MERGKLERDGSAEEPGVLPLGCEETTWRIIGAAIAVHRELGPGFVESVYHRAMQLELQHRRIEFTSELECTILFRGAVVGRHRFDLVVESRILVELKAVHCLEAVHFAQVRSYLEAGGFGIGLLLNFSASTLAIRRVLARRRSP